MVNPWFVHLSAFRKENPNLSMKQAMKAAKKSYKKVDGSNSIKKTRKVRKGRKSKGTKSKGRKSKGRKSRGRKSRRHTK